MREGLMKDHGKPNKIMRRQARSTAEAEGIIQKGKSENEARIRELNRQREPEVMEVISSRLKYFQNTKVRSAAFFTVCLTVFFHHVSDR